MVSSTVYEKVTYKQISDMKHAIGFDNGKVTGTKHRKYEPYRNYYCAGENDVSDWDYLVKIGFAIQCEDKQYYCVSNDGRYFLELVTGIKILEEMR